MKMLRRTLTIAILLFSICALAQTPASRYDPGHSGPKREQKSFSDFAFSRINPQDINYGERIEQWRQSVLDSTVRQYGFWADWFAIAMLGMAFTTMYWQHRQNQNVRFHAARLLAAYGSDLQQARAGRDQLQSEYERLKRLLEQRSEEAPEPKQAAVKRENLAPATSRVQLLENSAGQNAPEQQLRQENDRLKRQLGQENETSASLRRQVTTLTKRLEDEQQRTRKLRGE